MLQCLICYLIEGNQTVEASLVRSMSVLRKYARLCHIPFLHYLYYRTGAPIFEYRNHLARSIHVTEVPDRSFSGRKIYQHVTKPYQQILNSPGGSRLPPVKA